LGNPDMRTPIAHALAWPGRMDSGVPPLDLFSAGALEFAAPSLERFPCLGLAYRALRAGGTATTVLNAANEVAVEAFLAGEIRFPAMARLIEQTLSALEPEPAASLEGILAADARARDYAKDWLKRSASPR
jgi:1-deoxy-D-xylulose-5-phosphate reductoisomerase